MEAVRAGGGPRVPPWLRVWLHGWPATTHLVLDVVLAPLFLLVVIGSVAAFLSAPSIVTLPLAAAGLLVAFVLAAGERRRLRMFCGYWVTPWRDRPRDLPLWRRVLFDTRPWRALLHLFLVAVWGLVGGGFTLLALSVAVAGLVLSGLPGEPRVFADVPWLQVPVWIPAVVALSVVIALPVMSRLFVQVDRALARMLIGRGDAEEVRLLSERVDTLTRTREATVDSVEAERRRIERDLHDGPQQRLVAVAMDLGMAQARLAAGDAQGAGTLLARAHAAAKEAITEMRHVARGIHPPVLTDRGLDAALSALAARSPVPVSVRVELSGRPPARLEAILYFCVSEALTNVAKHARATRASVTVCDVHEAGEHLIRATVRDDGRGGAAPAAGSGLPGLRDRVASVDGRLSLSSPPGGPTALVVEVPFATTGSPPARPGPQRPPADQEVAP